MRTADFDYTLPSELIAQKPAPRRDGSRLLIVHRSEGRFEHRHFSDLPEYLRPGDVMVANDSRVLPARLRALRPPTDNPVEILLLEDLSPTLWWALLRPGKRVRVGTRLMLVPRPDNMARELSSPVTSSGDARECRLAELNVVATLRKKEPTGRCLIEFSGVTDPRAALELLGEVPLPPYVRRLGAPTVQDGLRYQTVYAREPGSVAAPTAGLHFTQPMLDGLSAMGVRVCYLTLHVGLGTFAPVKTVMLEDHVMHDERFVLPQSTADAVNQAKNANRRLIAVGTTVTRVLESAAAGECDVAREDRERDGQTASRNPDPGVPLPRGCRGRTGIFIHPPFHFNVVDALLTNFHLPKSTLLMLVCAMAAPGQTRGRDLVLAAYAEAIKLGYRFYSYGDAMLLI